MPTFIRWAVPGLAVAVEVAVAVALTYGIDLTSITEWGEGIAALLAVLIASGGLGYLFACAYMAISWHIRLAPDYRPLLRAVAGNVVIRGINTAVDVEDIRGRRAAWTTVVSHVSAQPELSNEHQLSERWAVFITSSGATFVGSTIALLAFALYASADPPQKEPVSIIAISVAWSVLVFFLWYAHHLAKMSLLRHTGSVFARSVHRGASEIVLGWQPPERRERRPTEWSTKTRRFVRGIVVVLMLIVGAVTAVAVSEHDDLLDVGTFTVLGLTLVALIVYAGDTGVMASIAEERWRRESVLNATYSMTDTGNPGVSAFTRFTLHNASTLLVKARVSCNFQVSGKAVAGPPEFDGRARFLVFPQQESLAGFHIEPLLQKGGKTIKQVLVERSPATAREQLTMDLAIEYEDELGERRRLPARRHWFNFDHAAWGWEPILTIED